VKKSKDTGSYEDFIECLKLYDKMENGTMMLGELEHILLSLGEKLGKTVAIFYNSAKNNGKWCYFIIIITSQILNFFKDQLKIILLVQKN
jgi:Ca2+-binding EF-hand superfamily protein